MSNKLEFFSYFKYFVDIFTHKFTTIIYYFIQENPFPLVYLCFKTFNMFYDEISMAQQHFIISSFTLYLEILTFVVYHLLGRKHINPLKYFNVSSGFVNCLGKSAVRYAEK